MNIYVEHLNEVISALFLGLLEPNMHTVPVPLGRGLCHRCARWGQEEVGQDQLLPLDYLHFLLNTHTNTVTCRTTA